MIKQIQFALFLSIICWSCQPTTTSDSFQSDWSKHPKIERSWAGAQYWLNPLQAWKQKEGKLHCEVSGGDRNAVLLTQEISEAGTSFTMQVDLENINTNEEGQERGWVGFQIGLKGEFGDYRDDAVHGRGLCLGVTSDGHLFIADTTITEEVGQLPNSFQLKLDAQLSTEGKYSLNLSLSDLEGQELKSIQAMIHPSWVQGLSALTCSQILPNPIDISTKRPEFSETPNLKKQAGGNTNFAFSNWQLSGDAVNQFPERAYGPIMWTQYTLSGNTLKMSAQLAPIGNGPSAVTLEVDGKQIAEEICDSKGNNALFRIENWESDKDHTFTVLYADGAGELHQYKGKIPASPQKEQIKVASLSCVDDVGFPHHDLVANVLDHQADVYLFHGDQIYERVGGYGVERSSTLDYLRKWYIWGWSFRDFFRNRPVVIIPDDHDVFHGNLWGEGGKRADISLGWGYDSQDDGGYKEPPEFVNMVHRTQTGHLPDAYDPTPVLNDISVYYTNMTYGGISFAILGDRQWKSAPKYLFPNAAIENGWPQNIQWNPKTDAFHPSAELLGERQEAFLENWVTDWNNAHFKVVVSQSPFCNVATLPKDIYHDKYVPGLPRYKRGEYPPDDRPVADFDSNGWPQNKRNKAIKTIRKAFALHLTGDQHLGSTGQYGTDEYGDGNYWVSSPAVSNLWPRRWYPAAQAPSGRSENDPRYVGDYEDGFGNKITVKAIANPYDLDRKPDKVFDKAPGYSIITFNKKDRTMNLAVWPRWASPNQESDNQPYPGWPMTISQMDNYGATTAGYLVEQEMDGATTIQVIDEKTNELVYAILPPAGTFKPKVFDADGVYTIQKVKAGEVIETSSNLKVE